VKPPKQFVYAAHRASVAMEQNQSSEKATWRTHSAGVSNV